MNTRLEKLEQSIDGVKEHLVYKEQNKKDNNNTTK